MGTKRYGVERGPRETEKWGVLRNRMQEER